MLIIDGNAITLTRGDSLPLEVTLKNKDGTEYEPIAGDVIRFAISKGYKGQANYTLIYKQTIDPATLAFTMPADETGKLDYITYNYDVEVTHPGGLVDTFISDKLTITGEVD